LILYLKSVSMNIFYLKLNFLIYLNRFNIITSKINYY
jgi:hypothetical protein